MQYVSAIILFAIAYVAVDMVRYIRRGIVRDRELARRAAMRRHPSARPLDRRTLAGRRVDDFTDSIGRGTRDDDA